jgi:hypothetical protein
MLEAYLRLTDGKTSIFKINHMNQKVIVITEHDIDEGSTIVVGVLEYNKDTSIDDSKKYIFEKCLYNEDDVEIKWESKFNIESTIDLVYSCRVIVEYEDDPTVNLFFSANVFSIFKI